MTLGEIFEVLQSKDKFWTMEMVQDELRNLVTELYVDCEGKIDSDELLALAWSKLEEYANS